MIISVDEGPTDRPLGSTSSPVELNVMKVAFFFSKVTSVSSTGYLIADEQGENAAAWQIGVALYSRSCHLATVQRLPR